jgi:uncharacterized Fe-S cluster-containing radical SAM superfamily protein
MGIFEPAIERLIKGTFLMESNLRELYDDNHKLYGLMMLSESNVDKIFNDYLRFNKRVAVKLKRTAFIDISKTTLEEFKEQLKSDLSLMVAVLYIHYNSENQEFPSDNLQEIAKFYVKYYIKENDAGIEQEFVDYYREVF